MKWYYFALLGLGLGFVVKEAEWAFIVGLLCISTVFTHIGIRIEKLEERR